ncbi:carbon-nitrogen hydrolase family protein [Kiloniella laminariae]|uniref:Carbon-nitrogen hydrolase family protein n=1 Tax=Kiloniella laminariae TaxID=454162 RepID=A0ABT4LG00_9PROT|nr:carbon-nitrogen hydrolase family protein [Kiloniella laminariae]MCZ4280025.1 carbon-nitrogen hydrolase family protein [Kiloniella laminariae]
MLRLQSTILLFALLFTHPSHADEAKPLQDVTAKNSPTSFRAALAQIDSADAGNFTKMTELAIKAKQNGANIIIFPESSLLGWLNPSAFTEAPPIPGNASQAFQEMAKTANIWIASGLAEQGPVPKNTKDEVHYAFDSAILVDPTGQLVLHQRKLNVLQNAFDADKCPKEVLNETGGCNYSRGEVSDITVIQTPFGKTALLVCADAYTSDTTALDKLKQLEPHLVIVTWGVGAQKEQECGQEWFNATTYSSQAAKYIGTANVVGTNAVGNRPYGRFRPAVYCGYSGFALPSGTVGGVVANTTAGLNYFDIPFPKTVEN